MKAGRPCGVSDCGSSTPSEPLASGLRIPSTIDSICPRQTATEPQTETPQGRPAFIRDGLEQTIEATETMITGIGNAGVPDTAQGAQSANAISAWADATLDDLEDAQDSLDNEADTLAEAISQLTDAARAITGAVTSGVKAVADVGRTDPELAAALRDSSTCRQLREETSS